MVYKVIGLMSGSSLDGLDIVLVHLQESAGTWQYDIRAAACYPYEAEWTERLRGAVHLNAEAYCRLHAEYGHYLGRAVRRFLREKGMELQADLIASHGHTTFHEPAAGMTAQLGDGAAIAAETDMAVVSDLRALDVALGGQGAPIVPVGEKLLFPGHRIFLNLGGIANVSFHGEDRTTAFDVCPANGLLNSLAAALGRPYDEEGQLARAGRLDTDLLEALNVLDYYRMPAPKSLANSFGTDTVLPLVGTRALSVQGKLRTCVEHIAVQVRNATAALLPQPLDPAAALPLLVTGGGAFNRFLVERLSALLGEIGVAVEVPAPEVVAYKEALIMALLGALRWRERHTILASVTGARRDSIGGALWMGQEG